MIDYAVSTLTLGVIWCVFTYAVNVTYGWTGQLDLAAFLYVAVGAYAYSVVCGPPATDPTTSWILGLRLPFFVGLAGAMLIAGVLGLLVGGVALRRLRDDYFAITTVVATLTLYTVIAQFSPLFDGYTGIYGVPQPLATTLNVEPGVYQFVLLGIAVIALVAVYFVMERVFRSPFGRVLRAVREDETAAAAFGRNVYRLKLKAYVLGATLAGLGGGLLAAFLTAFNAYSWAIGETFLLYAAIFVGGAGNNRGVIVGTFFIAVIVQEITRNFVNIPGHPDAADALRYMVVGLLIIGVLWLRPQGILPEPTDRDGEEAHRTRRLRLRGRAVDGRAASAGTGAE